MALFSVGCCQYFLVLALISSSLHSFGVHSTTEFEVGAEKGWVIPPPPSNDTALHLLLYNAWASSNRFQVQDTLRFVYKKDSVLVVSQEEYEQCHSTHPVFFSNSGNTIFKLDRPGLFYFISGVSGHCERGLKMIVKVLEPAAETPPPHQEANETAGSNPSNSFNSSSGPLSMLILFMAMSTFGGVFFM